MKELRSFPYDSVNNDREYSASYFRDYFRKFIGNGIYQGSYKGYGESSMKVEHLADNVIKVIKGAGIINGIDFELEEDYRVVIEGEGIFTVLIRTDERFDKRCTSIDVKEGTDLTQTHDIYEMALAEIRINDGVMEIEDKRERMHGELLAPYYPENELPELLWRYVVFPDSCTEEEKRYIENNPQLKGFADNSVRKPIEQYTHIGSILTTTKDMSGDPNFLKADGSIVMKEDYPELAETFDKSHKGYIFKNEEIEQNIYINNKYCGQLNTGEIIILSQSNGREYCRVVAIDSSNEIKVIYEYVGSSQKYCDCYVDGEDIYLTRSTIGANASVYLEKYTLNGYSKLITNINGSNMGSSGYWSSQVITTKDYIWFMAYQGSTNTIDQIRVLSKIDDSHVYSSSETNYIVGNMGVFDYENNNIAYSKRTSSSAKTKISVMSAPWSEIGKLNVKGNTEFLETYSGKIYNVDKERFAVVYRSYTTYFFERGNLASIATKGYVLEADCLKINDNYMYTAINFTSPSMRLISLLDKDLNIINLGVSPYNTDSTPNIFTHAIANLGNRIIIGIYTTAAMSNDAPMIIFELDASKIMLPKILDVNQSISSALASSYIKVRDMSE